MKDADIVMSGWHDPNVYLPDIMSSIWKTARYSEYGSPWIYSTLLVLLKDGGFTDAFYCTDGRFYSMGKEFKPYNVKWWIDVFEYLPALPEGV